MTKNNSAHVTTRHGMEEALKKDTHITVEETFLNNKSGEAVHKDADGSLEKSNPKGKLSEKEITDDVARIKAIIDEYEFSVVKLELHSEERTKLRLKCFNEINNILNDCE